MYVRAEISDCDIYIAAEKEVYLLASQYLVLVLQCIAHTDNRYHLTDQPAILEARASFNQDIVDFQALITEIMLKNIGQVSAR